jgi:arylsulfatase A-like enzyme
VSPLAWLAAAFLLSLSPAPAPAATAKPPHILVILADDLGIGDLGCYNPESRIRTPNLDRLAREGTRFTDAHSPSAVCTPTRYGLLTGRYSWRGSLPRGVLQGYGPSLIEPGRLTLPEMLRSRGYATAGIGKWHLGFQGDHTANPAAKTDYAQPLRPGPVTLGFDYFFGIPSSLDFEPYLYVENDRATAPPTNFIAASKHQREGGEGFWREGYIAPGFTHAGVLPTLTSQATNWLTRHAAAPGDKPFFLYLALASPHTPWLPSEKFRGRSRAGVYGDFVEETDAAIGAVLRALDRARLAPNTLVIVTSDNGAHWPAADIGKFGHRANLHWRGQKADIWEAGHRVPFIVRWPGKTPAGATNNALLCLTDLMATFAAVTGATLPDDAAEDSFNFLQVLRGKTLLKPVRDSVIHHSGDGHFALREKNWKLIPALGSGGFTPPKNPAPKAGEPAGQLYDLATDPAEQTNLWSRHPDLVQRMTESLTRMRREGRTR